MKRLIEKIAQMQNPSVVGLDSLLDYIPQHIKDEKFEQYGDSFDAAAQAILEYNKAIIDAICDIVPAIKPQAAYYELYSWQGMWALSETVRYAQSKGMIVIMDGKRNDIGSTMQAYAKAHLGTTALRDQQQAAFGSDMLTVNGYLGSDGIEPLLPICDEKDKGIFVLVKPPILPPASFRTRRSVIRPSMKRWALCARAGEKRPRIITVIPASVQ